MCTIHLKCGLFNCDSQYYFVKQMNKSEQEVNFSHNPIYKSKDPTWGHEAYFGSDLQIASFLPEVATEH